MTVYWHAQQHITYYQEYKLCTLDFINKILKNNKNEFINKNFRHPSGTEHSYTSGRTSPFPLPLRGP